MNWSIEGACLTMSTTPTPPGIRPLCFALMPFGRKPNPTPPPIEIDFDAVYQTLIAPAVQKAGMTPLRADSEMNGGLIHRPMYERLLVCDFAVADLTAANANVFYELGIRHAVRPWSTVLLFAEGTRLPFDVAPLRGLRYPLTETGVPRDADPFIANLTARLEEARKAACDSPLFQTLPGFPAPNLSALSAASFYDQVQNAADFKDQLAGVIENDQLNNEVKAEKLRETEAKLGDISRQDSALLVSLFYAYRAISAFKEMINLVGRMPDYVASGVQIQEQYALALNRDAQGAKAERVLIDLIERRGPSSETYGILGRVYKDRWLKTIQAQSSQILTNGLLDKAIDAYLRGFETDPRDFYPGINAITLMEVRQPPDPRRNDLVPVVRYALERKIRAVSPGYWEYATLLELAVLGNDKERALAALSSVLAAGGESWMCRTTANNIAIIRVAREQRAAADPWLHGIEEALVRA
jgi:hypothetical protein